MPAGEAVDVFDLGQDPAGDDRPDSVEVGEPGAVGLDEPADLATDRLGRAVEHDLTARDESLGQRTSSAVAALDVPTVLSSLAGE